MLVFSFLLCDLCPPRLNEARMKQKRSKPLRILRGDLMLIAVARFIRTRSTSLRSVTAVVHETAQRIVSLGVRVKCVIEIARTYINTSHARELTFEETELCSLMVLLYRHHGKVTPMPLGPQCN